MKRTIPALCLLLSIGLTRATAAPVQALDVPDQYIPGQSFKFQVTVPAMTGLAAYQIDLALTSDQGTAGIDFQFEEVLATSPASGYVFPSNNFFGSGTNTFTTSTQILSVTDLDLNGVNVMPGLNDQIATVNILTSSNFSGTLQLSIDANNLILDGPQVTPTSVPEFLSIRDATLASPVINITAVPEANSLLFMSIVSSSLALRRRNRSNRARVQLRNIRK